MRVRTLAAGLALFAAGSVVAVSSQQFAAADISDGNRPVLVPIESCRLVDTRPDFQVGPRTAPLGPAETYQVGTQQAGTECTGAIPTTASALAINVTAPQSSGASFITLWPDGPRPNTSVLNPQAGRLVFNAATVELAGDDTFFVYNNANNVHFLVDVVGYYEHHDHDDRYYTEAEVDDVLSSLVAADASAITMLPIARFTIESGLGVTGDEFRLPVTDSPTAVWGGTRWRVDVPGEVFDVRDQQALCTPGSGNGDVAVTVSSLGGDLLVYLRDFAGTPVEAFVNCVVYDDVT